MKKFTIFLFVLFTTLLSATTFYLESEEIINGKIISSKDGIIYIESGDNLVIVSRFLIKNAYAYGEDVLSERIEQYKDKKVDENKYSKIRKIIQEPKTIQKAKTEKVEEKTEIDDPKIVQKTITGEKKIVGEPITKPKITNPTLQDTIPAEKEIEVNSPVFKPKDSNIVKSEILTNKVIVMKSGKYLFGDIINYNKKNLVLKNLQSVKIPLRSNDIAFVFSKKDDLMSKMKPFSQASNNFEMIYEDHLTASRIAGRKLARKRVGVTPFVAGLLGGFIPIAGPLVFTSVAAILPVETPTEVPVIYNEYEFRNSYKTTRKTNRALATLLGSALVNVIIFTNLN